ncbi:MAG TPA: hypothetical protein VH061_10495 [Solirubrobacteraceae bacterium]|nr:hypothetical protein [Solirubrobacteraceae bacterium]
MKRFLPILAVVLSLACLAASASAASIRPPKLGAWTFDGGGFTVVKGTGRSRGKDLVENFHIKTPAEEGGCPETPVTATVLGKFPLKVFTRGGYSVWGVGRNVGGEAEPMPVKVSAGGTTVTGGFRMVWDFERVTSEVLGMTVSFGECTMYPAFATPKKK